MKGSLKKIINLEEKMKTAFRSIFVLFCSVLVFACASTPASKGRYQIVFDSSISDPFVQSAWMSYTADIRADMDKFYTENPEGEYIIPYSVETNARNSMIDFYLRVQKENKINDPYIEDLIKIRSLNKLNEYVFFSFNPGNWVNEKNFNEEEYNSWMKNKMPAHIPLTLAYVEKID